MGLWMGHAVPAIALPPPDDTPEEVLRTQIILEGRSPINNQPLNAEQYVQQEHQIHTALNQPPELSPQVQQVIFLLKIRRAVRLFIPIIP